MSQTPIITRWLGQRPYASVFDDMLAFTQGRHPNTDDELWLCTHEPVFTQGLAGRQEHVLAAGDIPVIASNRGGQVTYHGPGQLIAYPLLDLRRRGYFVKEYVYRLEEAVIKTLADFQVTGHRVRGAPGVYVRHARPFDHACLTESENNATTFPGLAKISALGVKVSQHCTLHGLAINVHMNLEPFQRINPCGYAGLVTTDLHTIGVPAEVEDALPRLQHHLQHLL